MQIRCFDNDFFSRRDIQLLDLIDAEELGDILSDLQAKKPAIQTDQRVNIEREAMHRDICGDIVFVPRGAHEIADGALMCNELDFLFLTKPDVVALEQGFPLRNFFRQFGIDPNDLRVFIGIFV